MPHFKPLDGRAITTYSKSSSKLKTHADKTKSAPALNTAYAHAKFICNVLQRERSPICARGVNRRAIGQPNTERRKIINDRGANQRLRCVRAARAHARHFFNEPGFADKLIRVKRARQLLRVDGHASKNVGLGVLDLR